MTIVKKLRLKGFKSFASPTELEFGNSFNCVIGSNGSGKSNVIDSMLFVLGELSAKSIRAEKSANLIFAGTKETPGEIIEIKGKKYKAYNGSASKSEKIKQVEKYNKDKNDKYTIHVEGVEGIVPYKGNVEDIIQKLLAGVRSGLAYAGALNIKDFYNKAEFIRITSGGIRESNYHDIIRHTS